MNILTVGTFDIPHIGHYILLKRLTLMGGDVWVGVNDDVFVEKYKGSKPILSFEERSATIEAWGYKTKRNYQDDGSIKDLIIWSNPEIIAIGSDWLRKPYLPQIGIDVDFLEKENISLLYTPYTRGISTTEIKRRCLAQ